MARILSLVVRLLHRLETTLDMRNRNCWVTIASTLRSMLMSTSAVDAFPEAAAAAAAAAPAALDAAEACCSRRRASFFSDRRLPPVARGGDGTESSAPPAVLFLLSASAFCAACGPDRMRKGYKKTALRERLQSPCVSWVSVASLAPWSMFASCATR